MYGMCFSLIETKSIGEFTPPPNEYLAVESSQLIGNALLSARMIELVICLSVPIRACSPPRVRLGQSNHETRRDAGKRKPLADHNQSTVPNGIIKLLA